MLEVVPCHQSALRSLWYLKMTKYNYLSDEEFIAQLLVRDDLTEIEHELLDRLIRARDALGGFGVPD